MQSRTTIYNNWNRFRAHSLESLMEGQNWFLNQFDEITQRSFIVGS